MVKRLLVIAIALVIGGAAGESAADEPQLIDYVVKPGDTCMGIAGRVLGDRQRYGLIHKYNPGMGRLPHRLKPGTILKLPDPAGFLRPDAKLTAKRGPVEVQKATEVEWGRALRGMDLFRAWKVNSLERASAEITFRDRSLIQMRENTLVVIYGPTSGRVRRQARTAELERGALRSRLGELTGGQGVSVVTPSAEAELGQGSALVSVDDAGTSRVANHAGKPVVVRGRTRRRARVVVERGMGSKVERDRSPTKPQPLPPTPGWAASTATRFVDTGQGGTISGEWAPVAGAARYRVEIASASGEVLAAVEVPAAVSRFEAHRLPEGSYQVSVAAIDGDGFEGISSPPRGFEVIGCQIFAPGAVDATASAAVAPGPDDDQPPAVAAPPPPARYLIGTTVVVPAGLSCSIDGGPSSPELILDRPGRHTIGCVDSTGAAAPPLAVEVAAVTAELDRAMPPLPRGRVTAVTLHLASELPLPDRLVARGPAGVALGELVMAPDGVASLAIDPGPDAPDSIAIIIAAGDGDRQTRLAELTLGVAAVEPAVVPEQLVARAISRVDNPLELGVFAGFDSFGDDSELGNAYRVTETPEASIELGLRAGYAFDPRFAVEVEARLSPTHLGDSGSAAQVFGWRVHGLARLPRLSQFRPFLCLGVGGETLFSGSPQVDSPDTDGALYYGVGFHHDLTDRAGTRLDLRGRLTPGHDHAVARGFEVQLAYFHRLGW